jgi:hypothetical protein
MQIVAAFISRGIQPSEIERMTTDDVHHYLEALEIIIQAENRR